LWRSNSPTPPKKMRRCGRLSWSNMAWRIVWPIPLLRGLAMGSRVAAVWVQPWSIAWGSSCTKRPLPKTKPWNSTKELLGCWNYCNGMVWSQKGGTTRILWLWRVKLPFFSRQKREMTCHVKGDPSNMAEIAIWYWCWFDRCTARCTTARCFAVCPATRRCWAWNGLLNRRGPVPGKTGNRWEWHGSRAMKEPV
jgi:hypothetical protein